MHGTSTLQVDLDAIARNVGQLRAMCAPGVRFCAVLKADAYGLGARGVMSTLKQAGSSMFAVFSPGEACELSDIDLPLLVLMPVMAGDVPGNSWPRPPMAACTSSFTSRLSSNRSIRSEDDSMSNYRCISRSTPDCIVEVVNHGTPSSSPARSIVHKV